MRGLRGEAPGAAAPTHAALDALMELFPDSPRAGPGM